MSNNTVISVENLSLAYPIYNSPKDMVLEFFTGKLRHDTFWALRDINFSLFKNQRLGIIGSNGAGKSSLLKLVSGNISPTAGNIKVNGNISAMLSLGSLLNPEESGLSNIRFNLLVNGCQKSEIPRLTEEIIEFCELGAFIYSPVKTYSSGMNARLSFAISTTIEPEILVIDEILSVGDAYFVGKAIKRMLDLCSRGKALIFVSHNISDIKKLCDNVIWLENGSIREIGTVNTVCTHYEEDSVKRRSESEREDNIKRKKEQDKSFYLGGILDFYVYPLRIISSESKSCFKDTHYIRNIKLTRDGEATYDLDLSIVDSKDENVVAWLDLLNSEWGRIYTRLNFQSRTLSVRTGKDKGGRIFLRLKKENITNNIYNSKLIFEVNSLSKREKLEVEFLDYLSGNWRKVESIEYQKINKDWDKVIVNLEIPIVQEQVFKDALKKLDHIVQSDVEIIDVSLLVDGKESYVVKERQPFEVRVKIKVHRMTPKADVTINIYRSDGTYIFCQSSGMNKDNIYDTSRNLTDVLGDFNVYFIFKDNYFNEGQYHISAYCSNGWDVSVNLPHSELFDAKINAFTFSVIREFNIHLLDFGQINMQVPVKYVKED